MISDASQLAYDFNKFFFSVVVSKDHVQLNHRHSPRTESPAASTASMALSPVTEEELEHIIQNLPTKKITWPKFNLNMASKEILSKHSSATN